MSEPTRGDAERELRKILGRAPANLYSPEGEKWIECVAVLASAAVHFPSGRRSQGGEQ